MATGARVTQQKAYTLDALRATAALLVLMLHIAPLAKPLGVDIPWNGVGTLGVHLFFVLSGYLITSAVLSRSYTPRRYALRTAPSGSSRRTSSRSPWCCSSATRRT